MEKKLALALAEGGIEGESPDQKIKEIREALVGNLCRCTGYVRIIEGIKQAARI